MKTNTVKKIEGLTTEQKELITDSFKDIYEFITYMNKFPLHSHRHFEHYDKKIKQRIEIENEYWLGGMNKDTAYAELYFSCCDSSPAWQRYSLSFRPTEKCNFIDGNCGFKFSKKQMGKPFYRRHKLVARLIYESFNFDLESMKMFLEGESEFNEEIRWIDYE